MSEEEFIEWFSESTPRFGRAKIGIGDDAAVIPMSGSMVVTTDMLMDGVDFDAAVHRPELIGRKSFAVNLSDIAAMGCTPTTALVSVAISKGTKTEWLKRLAIGMFEICDQFRVEIVGGDTNSWSSPLAISVTMHGTCGSREPILRSGAKVGDWLMVSGALGGSIYGRHLEFLPRIELGQWLSTYFNIHAMMDLSDGIASDLARLCRASGVGALIRKQQLPIHLDVQSRFPNSEWVRHALTDGEDFELLFCCPSDVGKSLLNSPNGASFSQIGEVIAGDKILLESSDGKTSELVSKGYSHVW